MRQKTMWSRRDFLASGLAGVSLTATLPPLWMPGNGCAQTGTRFGS